jgi:hypothetical protein
VRNLALAQEKVTTFRAMADQFVRALEPEDLETLVERGNHIGDMPEAARYLIWYVNARDRAAGRKPPSKPRALRRIP